MTSTGHTVTRNSVLNVLGQALPLLVGVVAIPVAAQHLGDGRFGLLGLVWAILGYFGVLDLGLGRATTRFVAGCLARRDVAGVRGVVTLSVVAQTLVGVVGGLALVLLAPMLAGRALGVPVALVDEATSTLQLAGASVPFVALVLALRAVLEGAQRFDLVNLIRTPGTVAVFLVPAIAAPLGAGLPTIIAALLATRIALCWASFVALRRAVPGFAWDLRAARSVAGRVLRYGGWVGLSNVLSPLLGYGERFVLSARAGVVAVAYYAAPYEAVTRLLIGPSALASALLPALSGTAPPGDREELLQRGLRVLVLLFAPPVFVVMALAGPLAGAWLGPDYASRSGPALALLALGVLVNGLAHLPYVYLLGCDRPDLPAKFHLLELPLFALVAWILTGKYGATGAAAAWTGRVALDAVLLGLAVRHIGGRVPTRLLGERGGRALGGVLVFGCVLIAAPRVLGPDVTRLVGVVFGAGVALLIWTWRVVLSAAERGTVAAGWRTTVRRVSGA